MNKASKKERKKTDERDGPLPVKPPMETFDTAYFIAEATLDEPLEPTRRPPSPAEEPPTPTAVTPPLAPMAALWPNPGTSPAKVTGDTRVTPPPATLKIKVAFVLPEPEARHVALAGEFNSWSPDATPMKRQADGIWETIIALAPGRYEYKFVVDGQWIPDPLARENVGNQQGTLNSVVEVHA